MPYTINNNGYWGSTPVLECIDPLWLSDDSKFTGDVKESGVGNFVKLIIYNSFGLVIDTNQPSTIVNAFLKWHKENPDIKIVHILKMLVDNNMKSLNIDISEILIPHIPSTVNVVFHTVI